MRILLLSFHFPPDAPMAATRAPKLARYLLDGGHDVRVLCARDPQHVQTHRLDIDPDRVVRTGWRDLRALPESVLARLGLASGGAPSELTDPTRARSRPAPQRPTLRNRLSRLYDAAICRPDRCYGWRGPALEGAAALFETWRPDVIYATCPPHSVAPIAAEIARLAGAPFIAEFRDRWGENAYSDHPAWRTRLDARQERAVLSQAAAIVTVSPLWAEGYAAQYGAENVTLAMNGFEPSDYPAEPPVPPNRERGTLHLLHAGALYPNRRDPRTIFAAIAALGDAARQIRVTMMGKDVGPARAMASEAGISDQLDLIAPEPHAQVIARQYAADALLLLQWNDPRDAGTIPGKLFEYAGARRPVIATGCANGSTAAIILQRNLGILSNDPQEIAAALHRLLERKRDAGLTPPLPETVRDGLSCIEQFAALDPLLHRVAGLAPRLAAAE